MGYYLLDNPNPHGPHYYTTRRGRVLAIVVHVTAGLEDLDATADHSAENTARYAATTDRAVSWHSGSDSDTVLDLLPASYTAFQCRGYNSTTYGHEISKADPDWRDAPEPWRSRTLTLAGRHLGAKARQLGVPIRKATKAELDRAIATGGAPVGFIGHTELDPDRRRDPGLVPGVGDTFPWTEFLAAARGATPTEEDWLTMATEADVRRIVAQELEKRDSAPPYRVVAEGWKPGMPVYHTDFGLYIHEVEQDGPLDSFIQGTLRLGGEDIRAIRVHQSVIDELLRVTRA